MQAIYSSSNLNENLQMAIQSGSYERSLAYLIQGAKATCESASSGRTAVGTAALIGDVEILELLLQSCEEPDLYIFNSVDVDVENTPDGMDCLEWEDEFVQNPDDTSLKKNNDDEDDFMEEFTSLYYYYAKTLENTGSLIAYIRDNHSLTKRIQDAHTPDARSKTPLHHAAANGHVECARILLKHGAKINLTDDKGRTPLHLCLRYDDVVKLLLECGANVNTKEYNTCNTPMHLALKNGRTNAAKAIIDSNQLQINETNANAETYLISAILNDNNDIANELLHRGALLNWQDKDGHTALYYSVTRNNVSFTGHLLKRGARIITSHYLLHYCILHDMTEMLEVFLSYDPYFNGLFVRNFEHFEPLALAVFQHRSHILERILALVSARQPDLLSFLHLEDSFLVAAQFIEDLPTFVHMARLLMLYSNGAVMRDAIDSSNFNLNYSQTKGNSVLAVTLILRKFNLAEFLLLEGADVKQISHHIEYLRYAMPKGCNEFLSLLIQMGFKYPHCNPESMPSEWSKQRRQIEFDLYQQCCTPLTLQALTRIAIRKHLIDRYYSSSMAFRKRFRCTLHKSSLQLMIESLDLPSVLQNYLFYFKNYYYAS